MKTLEEQFTELYGPPVKSYHNNLVYTCPKCHHKSLACDIVRGLRNCFVCSYGKGLAPIQGTPGTTTTQTIDSKIQLEVLKEILEISTLSRVCRDYLTKRSIINPEKYGLKTVPFQLANLLRSKFSNDELRSSGFFWEREGVLLPTQSVLPRRLIIPLWHQDTLVGCKTRIGPNVNTDERKYSSPLGTPIGEILWHRKTPRKDLYITEGELKAICLDSHGFTCCAVSGIGNACKGGSIKVELDRLVSNCSRFFIVFDTDPDIFQDPHKLKYPLSLAQRYLNKSCIVFFPQDNNEKVDIDSFISHNSIYDFEDLIEDCWIARDKTLKRVENIVNDQRV